MNPKKVTRDFIVKQSTYSFYICRQSQAKVKLIRGLGDDADNGSYVMEIDAHNTKPFRVVVHVDSIDSFKGRVFTELW